MAEGRKFKRLKIKSVATKWLKGCMASFLSYKMHDWQIIYKNTPPWGLLFTHLFQGIVPDYGPSLFFFLSSSFFPLLSFQFVHFVWLRPLQRAWQQIQAADLSMSTIHLYQTWHDKTNLYKLKDFWLEMSFHFVTTSVGNDTIFLEIGIKKEMTHTYTKEQRKNGQHRLPMKRACQAGKGAYLHSMQVH